MTMDMTNNRVPYGLLTDEELEALWRHKDERGEFEYYTGCWERDEKPSWGFDTVYRTVPLPKTQDVIAWEKLPSNAVVVARDKNGEVHFYTDPDCYPDGTQWVVEGECDCRRIDDFPGIVRIGTCDWRDSKQRRPK